MEPIVQPLPQSPYKKLLFFSVAILVLIFTICSYFLGYQNGKSEGVQEEAASIVVPSSVPSPIVTIPLPPSQSMTIKPTISPLNPSTGTVSGTLCYPGDQVPPGNLIAKNISTQEIFTQDYPGSKYAVPAVYSFSLKPGQYHIKLDTYSNGFNGQPYSGHYTTYNECVGNKDAGYMSICIGQQDRPLLSFTIEAGKETSNVNPCDFYSYPDTQPDF